MNEELKNSKNSKKVAIFLICCLVLLVVVIGGVFLFNTSYKTGKTEQDKNNVIAIQTNPQKETKAEFKYDLVNNILSNFDIAFLKLENSKENKIYSPLSIKYTLKMLEEGASGEAKEQISEVLKDYKITDYVSNKNMSFANALFVRNEFKEHIKQNYINNLKNKYNAEVVYDAFESAENVNKWVKNKTLNIIPEILDNLDKESDTNFLLINALGIDMEWKNKFLGFERLANGFDDYITYYHENYGARCNTIDVVSKKFDNNKQEVSGMEFFASIDNYDIVTILGEENIRKTVEEKYREWIKQNGTDQFGEPLTDETAIEKEISKYLDNYIKDLKENYNNFGESKSTDFSIYVDDEVKVFAKDLKEYNGVTLQYVGIMPTSQNLDEYIKSIDNTNLHKIINNLKELKRENFKDGVITKITGFIPKFNFEYTLKLKEDLGNMGITAVFDETNADLSELTDVAGEYINDAIHKANIEFTQDGIKAAAATVVGGAGAGEPDFDYIYDVPVEEIDLTFDKPYMFIIRDKDTEDVWFTGTVYEPLAWDKDETRSNK